MVEVDGCNILASLVFSYFYNSRIDRYGIVEMSHVTCCGWQALTPSKS